MKDLLFDPIKHDMVMSSTGDFTTTSNPSVQRGAIFLNARCFNHSNPSLGVSINTTFNGDLAVLTYEMNRWQAQCLADGATVAKWSVKMVNGQPQVTTEVSWL